MIIVNIKEKMCARLHPWVR